MKIKETDLFYPIDKYFKALDYVVNTEVENKNGYKRADMILTKDNTNELIGIEFKTSLSFELLDQADYWTKYTDYNYICVPKIKTQRVPVIKKIINYLGFGLIEIDLKKYKRNYPTNNEEVRLIQGKPDTNSLGIHLTILPHENYPKDIDKSNLRSVIYKEHQTWSISGQALKDGGVYVSGYKLLMCHIYKYLRNLKKNHPDTDGWATLKDICDDVNQNGTNTIRNYYSNQKAGIRQGIKDFEAGDIEIMSDGRRLHYRVMDESTKYLNM